MTNNVLITSAGKRVELMLEFKKELAKVDGKVYAVDLNPSMSPACHLSDGSFFVNRVTSPEYIQQLLDICINNNIKIVVPTIDTELAYLANAREYFLNEGIEIIVSDPEFISICRDKRQTAKFLKSLDIRVPSPRDKNNPTFPMFAKPYDGSLSTNIHIIKTLSELTDEIINDPKLMFMEVINKDEYKEYTVDMYYSKDHHIKSIVPRERIEIRSGEINKGATRKNFLVDFLKERMEYLSGVRGCICIQLFYRERDNDVIGIEINPRYGGGYPLSYYAGANFPLMMIQEYIEEAKIDYSGDWQDNVVMLRYDSQVIFKEHEYVE